MKHEFILDGIRRTIALEKKGDRFVIREGTDELEADIRRVSENEIELRAGGLCQTVCLARDGQRRFIGVRGRFFILSEVSRDAARFAAGEDKAADGGSSVKAPMPGRVIQLNVAEGQEVRKHQSLLIVEAMKMENDIHSPADGVVKKIHVAAGELVDAEKTLVELELKK